MIELLERLINPAASEENKPDLTPEFYFDEAAFEAEFNPPEEQEQVISVSMRMATAVGTAALLTAGVIGHEVGQPNEHQLEISAEQIAEDLNSSHRTTEPVIIEQGSELIIDKENSKDKAISVVNPIKLSDDTYGALVFEENGKVKVVEVPSSKASLKPVETGDKDETESDEIVNHVSVVYTEVPTKGEATERVYSAVAGNVSGNAADAVSIDTQQASPEQKRLLKDKTLRKLVKNAVSLTVEHVGYLEVND